MADEPLTLEPSRSERDRAIALFVASFNLGAVWQSRHTFQGDWSALFDERYAELMKATEVGST